MLHNVLADIANAFTGLGGNVVSAIEQTFETRLENIFIFLFLVWMVGGYFTSKGGGGSSKGGGGGGGHH
jgi:hypothetical protein